MVCDRCITAVRNTLESVRLNYRNIKLGEVELNGDFSAEQKDRLARALQSQGFELLDDHRAQTVEKIKNTIISLIHRNEQDPNLKLSVLLSGTIGMDYHYLSSLFSSVEGITIERYAILQRIERAKELLMYDELSLAEIADVMAYSSVQHLSQQFKKITGLTPSDFRKLTEKDRKPLDKL